MIHCPTCNALRNPEEPCPGCLVSLGLQPPEPDRADRRLLMALGLGLALGLSVSLTGLGALATWMSQAAVASNTTESTSVTAEREALQAERERLAAERQRLEASRQRLEAERERLEEAALRADQGFAVEVQDAVDARSRHARATATAQHAEQERQARAREEAERAAERAARRAELATHQRESARRAAELAALDEERAMRARESAEKAAEVAARQREEHARRAAALSDRTRLEAEAISLGASCEDLVALEAQAILGRLTARERACLEGGRAGSEARAVSRLLMVDAFSAGETERWQRYASHHVLRIEEDPNVAYKLAVHARNSNLPAEVLRWTAIALGQRTQWTGEQYTSRVGALYEMRHGARLALKGAHDPMTVEAAEEWRQFLMLAGRPLPDALK